MKRRNCPRVLQGVLDCYAYERLWALSNWIKNILINNPNILKNLIFIVLIFTLWIIMKKSNEILKR